MVRAYFGIKGESDPSPYLPNSRSKEESAPTPHHNPSVEELMGIIGGFPELRGQ